MEMGVSQARLAERCQRLTWDIGRDTIAKIEARTRWVGDFELVFLARCLDVPVTKLLPAR